MKVKLLTAGDALSISGGSVSGSERQVKSWAFETYDNLDK